MDRRSRRDQRRGWVFSRPTGRCLPDLGYSATFPVQLNWRNAQGFSASRLRGWGAPGLTSTATSLVVFVFVFVFVVFVFVVLVLVVLVFVVRAGLFVLVELAVVPGAFVL